MLQVLNVSAVSNEVCIGYHGNTVHESHLCTLTKEGEGVCSVSNRFMGTENFRFNLNKRVSMSFITFFVGQG